MHGVLASTFPTRQVDADVELDLLPSLETEAAAAADATAKADAEAAAARAAEAAVADAARAEAAAAAESAAREARRVEAIGQLAGLAHAVSSDEAAAATVAVVVRCPDGTRCARDFRRNHPLAALWCARSSVTNSSAVTCLRVP